MTTVAGEREIQLLERYVPEAEVLGVVREGRGLLLQLPEDSAHAAAVQKYEQMLIKAGVREWTWHHTSRGMRVRAYWSPHDYRHLWPRMLLAAVFAVAAYLKYDVHAAQVAARWLATLQ